MVPSQRKVVACSAASVASLVCRLIPRTYDAADLGARSVNLDVLLRELCQLSRPLCHVEDVGVRVEVVDAVRILLLQLLKSLRRKFKLCDRSSARLVS